MNFARYVYTGNKEIQDAGSLQAVPGNACNWKISYSILQSRQQNVILQQKHSYLIYNRRDKLQNACPADIKILKHITRTDRDDLHSISERQEPDVDFEEYEARSDEYTSDLDQLEKPKPSTWHEYRKLVEAADSKKRKIRRSPLMHLTSLPKIEINTGKFKPQSYIHARAKRSIIKLGIQRTILIANTNYVQFRNFKLNKLYKKTITLQNVSASPAKFQIEPRPCRSKFQVVIKRKESDRNIVPPGMQFQLNILFRCDDVDEPQEILVLNVEHGKSLIIKLRGYIEPPILLGTCSLSRVSLDILETKAKLLVQNWRLDTSSSDESTESSEESVMYSVHSWDTIHNKFASMTFDCKAAFLGETVFVRIKFKNIGGDGRFFVMGEIDWTSMYIQDITDTNVLKLSCFNIWPAYFVMKSQEEMIFYMSFLPECYGVHVNI